MARHLHFMHRWSLWSRKVQGRTGVWWRLQLKAREGEGKRQVQNIVFFYSCFYKLKFEMWESCNCHRRQDKLAKAGSILFYLEAIRPCLLIANVLSEEQCQHTAKSDYLKHSDYYPVSWSKKFCLCLYLLKIISLFLFLKIFLK